MASEPVKMDQDVEDQWKRVRGRLRAELGEAAFKTWLRPLSLDGVSGNEVVMRVPSGNMKDWVMSRCGERLHDLWCGENESVTGIMIKVGKPERRAPRREVTPVRRDLDLIRHDGNALDASAEADQLAASLDPRFTFENFVVGKTNEFAHAAAQRVAAADSVTFNPLFLYGGVGLGKTHLMHAIAWHIRTKKPGRRVLYMSAEKFMYKFIRAIRYKDTMAFKDQFRAVDVLMIDDIQFIAGKDSTQEEFFHTFNALVDQNRQVVISGDRSPSDLDGMEERLRSRL
ncbi:MAG: ATP-binding protein, partial [Rhodospirillaceae bacterium]|nr:ATP-binding protein [Rhodospirillaceae bacterium]